jgi:hypothetical protein
LQRAQPVLLPHLLLAYVEQVWLPCCCWLVGNSLESLCL